MNLLQIFRRFPDQEACVEHLEKIRFANEPFCPLCGTVGECARKAENDVIGRRNCHACKSSFNVLSGTIFQKTKIPLQNWFLAIGLVVNARKSLSSCQLARDLQMNQKSAWFMQQRIRSEMASKQGYILLWGIVEPDETYLGGKARKSNRRKDHKDNKNRRGRRTDKTPVIGAVARGGKAIAQPADDLTGKGIPAFIKDSVDPTSCLLVTDEYKAYNAIRKEFDHEVIRHQQEYARTGIPTDTIEGVSSLLKRAWYGSHHHYTKQFTPLFVAETAWKYNNRKNEFAFDTFMRGCFA